MAKKTYRTIYLNDELDQLLQKKAQEEQSSISRLVRISLIRQLMLNDLDESGCTTMGGSIANEMEV